MIFRKGMMLAAVLFFSALIPVCVQAATLLVTTSTNSGPGSFREAAILAMPGDTILFSIATYGDTVRLTTGPVLINNNVRIIGIGVDSTIISGTNQSRILIVNPGVSAVLEKLNLVQGRAIADSGGAIYNRGSLTLISCKVTNSSAAMGGGICNKSIINLSQSFIRDNTATSQGGGIFSISSATTITNNSQITNNTAIAGGGIYAQGNLTMTNTQVNQNSATNGYGGGIYTSGLPKLTACTIYNNFSLGTPSGGGGIYCNNVLQVTSCSIYGNVANGDGGGILSTNISNIIFTTIRNNISESNGGGFKNEGSSFISTCTFSNNQADGNGGGIASSKLTIERSTISENNADGNGGGIVTTDTLKLYNVLNAENSAGGTSPDVLSQNGIPVSQGYNLIGNITGIGSNFNPQSTDILGTAANPVDAMLGPLTNNGGNTLTHEPLCGSPAIDKGSAAGASATDQRGAPRVHGSAMDIGAVETQLDPVTVNAIINNETSAGSADGRIELVAAGGTPPYFYEWNDGRETVIITGLSSGLFSVTVSDFQGCSVSGIFTVGGVINSAQDVLSETIISIFPNPATDKIFIHAENKLNLSVIRLIDISGKIVKRIFPAENDLIEIAVADLTPGWYSLEMETRNGERLNGRFLKGF